MTTPHDPAAIGQLSIGDTITRDGHELMWDSGQWVHSPDCRHEVDPAAIRARLHLTLDEMAARMFVNRATVWRWEHGATPRPRHMRALAKLAKETGSGSASSAP